MACVTSSRGGAETIGGQASGSRNPGPSEARLPPVLVAEAPRAGGMGSVSPKAAGFGMRPFASTML